ncbi:MAG: SRPBCC domain-containing protein [Acidobacteriia bacterium]|nr:SRPBCC domain-containing protein [Terriglobia bacterium]
MSAEGDADKVVIRRRITATREELFDAWTDSEGMRAWMCPGNIVSVDVRMDLRVGGSLLIIMRDPDKAYEHRDEFTIIDRPAKLAFTWIAEATDLHPTLVNSGVLRSQRVRERPYPDAREDSNLSYYQPYG